MKLDFHSTRIKSHWVAYALVTGVACFMFLTAWSAKQEQIWADMQETAHEAAREVGLSTRSAREIVGMLQGVANGLFQQNDLDLSVENRQALVARKDKPGIVVQLPRPQAPHLLATTYNLYTLSPAFSMFGEIPPPGSETSREIDIALLLGPALIRAKASQPAAASVYYLSGRGFHNIFPPDPDVDIQLFSPELLTRAPYLNGRPDRNADRIPIWSEVYDDPKSSSLISTLSVPVDDANGNYRGVMAMDFALDTLAQFVQRPGLGIGTALIVDGTGTVLAHPTLVRGASDKAPTLKQAAQETGASNDWSSLLKIPANNRHTLGGQFVLAYDIQATPWRYLFVVNRDQLRWKALKGMHVEAGGMIALLILMLYAETRRREAVLALRRKAAEEVLYTAPAPVAVVHKTDFSIHLTNNALLRLFDTTEQLDSERARASAHIQLHGLLKNLSQQGQIQSDNLVEACLQRADSSSFWVLLRCVPFIHEDKEAWLCSLTDVTALKQAQEQLQTLATTDALTGALNRRAILTRGADEIKRSKRSGSSFGVMLLDIDHFKRVNDTYGHPTGDRVLQAVSNASKSTLRESDVFGRWGGEEFIALLSDTPMEGALKAAERLRHAIEKMLVLNDAEEPISLTVSIGVAVWLNQDDTLEELISRSDMALYAAKESGRNRVCAAPRLLDTTVSGDRSAQ